MHRRTAQKAAATAAAVACLGVINAFLSFSSWSVDFDPTDISRRLDIRTRIIDSLQEERGVSPGDPDFQRLFLARLDKMKKQSKEPTARRIALRSLEDQKKVWMRKNKEIENELRETYKSSVNNHEGVLDNVEPLHVCGRSTGVGTRADLALLEHVRAGVDKTCPGANSNKLLLLRGHNTYGKTGNNLIEV